MANTPKDLGYIDIPFSLAPESTKDFEGTYESDNELIAYFRLSSEEP
ncbi:hypothetical protein RI845_02790 [Thalassotalea nanhaiensis]|uniref:Uncharacterized protein n=1 Tax=Thalassotalea nanhaiensis TaxID=3065648 RepID=A0ABY9TK73_9GAMM|nr:hypothetical protein RI845_02790 [Colwelliaceae bacterium SQ345]